MIAKDHHFLGTITFYRTIGKENFKYDDIFVLDMLKDHLPIGWKSIKDGQGRKEKSLR